MTSEDSPAIILAVGSKKGGVGKTTISQNISAGAGKAGWRVLHLDVDPQAPIQKALQANLNIDLHPGDTHSLTSALMAAVTRSAEIHTREAIHESVWENVDVLSAHHDEMERVTQELKTKGAIANTALRRVLDRVIYDYDLIVIDTPPELGGMEELALIAADYAVAVGAPRDLDIQPGLDFIKQVRDLKDYGSSDVEVLGWIWNNYDRAASETQMQEISIGGAEPDLPIFDTYLPPSRQASSANIFGGPAVIHFENYPFGQRVVALVSEILSHISLDTRPATAGERLDALVNAKVDAEPKHEVGA